MIMAPEKTDAIKIFIEKTEEIPDPAVGKTPKSRCQARSDNMTEDNFSPPPQILMSSHFVKFWGPFQHPLVRLCTGPVSKVMVNKLVSQARF